MLTARGKPGPGQLDIFQSNGYLQSHTVILTANCPL